MNKFLFLIVVVASTSLVLFSSANSIEANAQQQTPPGLEKAPTTAATSTADSTISLGKITIQISQTEQIIIDLPLKSDNKYTVVPIK